MTDIPSDYPETAYLRDHAGRSPVRPVLRDSLEEDGPDREEVRVTSHPDNPSVEELSVRPPKAACHSIPLTFPPSAVATQTEFEDECGLATRDVEDDLPGIRPMLLRSCHRSSVAVEHGDRKRNICTYRVVRTEVARRRRKMGSVNRGRRRILLAYAFALPVIMFGINYERGRSRGESPGLAVVASLCRHRVKTDPLSPPQN
jgi:hypothetical protein